MWVLVVWSLCWWTLESASLHLYDNLLTSFPLFVSTLLSMMGSSSLTSTGGYKQASLTLDNLDNFLEFCKPDDGPQVQLMIKTGSDGFASDWCTMQSTKSHLDDDLMTSTVPSSF
ncbi:unnamed protein product [Schistocephalus solidus]|uniref:Secreted protein n=1 Tax=Schistocephalus solidus TaxID=70667 RepID=A0A183TT69_SCHSO|nr:unnamed protein product [Schistocephalus solidus]